MNYNKVEMYKNNTVHIKTKDVTFGYEMNKNDLQLLYKTGYDAVTEKFS
jgi:hypothetical protein